MLTTGITALQLWLSTLIRDPIGTLRALPENLFMALFGISLAGITAVQASRFYILITACSMELSIAKILSPLVGDGTPIFDIKECLNPQGLRVSHILVKLFIMTGCLCYAYKSWSDEVAEKGGTIAVLGQYVILGVAPVLYFLFFVL